MAELLSLGGTVGLGTWAVGGYPPERDPLPDGSLEELIVAGRQLGVGWIDTAGVYGLGRVERLLGELRRTTSVLDGLPIVTKCGIGWTGRPGMAMIDHRGDRGALRRDCEESLHRLGLDRLDVLLLHHRDAHGVPVAESWNALIELRDEGLVERIGVSNLTIDELSTCSAIEVPAFHQLGIETTSDFEAAAMWGARHGITNMVFGVVKAAISAGVPPGDGLMQWRTRFPSASVVVGASTPAQLKDLLAPK